MFALPDGTAVETADAVVVVKTPVAVGNVELETVLTVPFPYGADPIAEELGVAEAMLDGQTTEELEYTGRVNVQVSGQDRVRVVAYKTSDPCFFLFPIFKHT